MAVTIRLLRLGKKNFPVYRIVAIDKRKKRNGTYVDVLGSYSPASNPSSLTVNTEKVDAWIKKGAQLSEGFEKLLNQIKAQNVKKG